VRENKQQVIADFDEVANMTPEELEEWLEIDESREVGQKDADGESTGHRSGRRIVEIPTREEVRPHRRRPRSHEKRHWLRKAPPEAEAEE
jgi:Protein of unknown function (DUF3140)